MLNELIDALQFTGGFLPHQYRKVRPAPRRVTLNGRNRADGIAAFSKQQVDVTGGRMRSGISGATAAKPSVELSISPAETVPGFSENSDLTTRFFAWADKMLTR